MSGHPMIGLQCVLAVVASVAMSVEAAEPNARLEIIGDYRYKAQASEALADAKDLACREALRQAVVNSALYREQTAGIVDSALLREVANTLATRHVQDQQILEQSEQGRTMFCRVKAFLPAEESASAIQTQLAGGPAPAESLDQNRVLRLLNVKEESQGMLFIDRKSTRLNSSHR